VSLWSAGSDRDDARPPLQLTVDDVSRVGEARRATVAFAGALGFDEGRMSDVALVTTEAATNVARHGGGGYLLVRAMNDGHGIEIIAVDRGPGMADPERCLRDGFSTGGTSGTGLGAIRRIADVFDIYSAPGAGTVVLAQLLGRSATLPEHAQVGAVCLAAPNEPVRGDGWALEDGGPEVRICVADGLGHGRFAHEASLAALELFRRQAMRSPAEQLRAMHLALRSTRGAAVATLRIERRDGNVRFAGIGNISCTLVAPDGQRSLPSHNGIIGHELRTAQEFTVPWTGRSMLVIHSDGLATRWRLDKYPGLAARHPAIVAAVLHRDFTRGRDDVTVLVVRDLPGGAWSS